MSLIQNHFQVPLINTALQNMHVEVPHCFRPTLAVNSKRLTQKFLMQSVEAVRQSFMHPETSVRGDIRRNEVDVRLALAFEALRVMYFEEKLGLNQSLDILPSVLIDTLRGGHEAGVMTDGRGCSASATRWIVPGSEQMDVANPNTDVVADLEAEA